jgi:hypothetical protein
MLYKMHIVASKEDVVVPKYDTQLDALHNYLRYYKALIKERVIKTNQLEAALHRGDETFIIRKLRSKIITPPPNNLNFSRIKVLFYRCLS